MSRTLKAPLNITRLLIELIATIAIAEAVVMFILPLLVTYAPEHIEAALDAALLAIIAGPILLWRMHAAVKRTEINLVRHSHAHSSRQLLIVAGVLIIGMGASIAAAMAASREVHHEARAEFDHLTDRLSMETQRRVNQVRYGLMGAKGAIESNAGELNREQFARYVYSRDLPREFPGAIGFGFIKRIERSNIEDFIARERALGESDFAISSLAKPGSPLADMPDLYVIKHCFPRERNAAAWGLDIGSEQNRREAAEQAVDTGLPTISGRIELVQDGKNQTAFLYYVPVYKSAMPTTTPAERRVALLGLLYSPIILKETLAGIPDAEGGHLDFEIFDGPVATNEMLLYDHDQHLDGEDGDIFAPAYQDRLFTAKTPIQIGGHQWTMLTSTHDLFESKVNSGTPIMIGVGGSLLSLLLTGFIYSLLTGRSRAIATAEAMNDDLSQAKAAAEEAARETQGFRWALDHHSIISVTDRRGRIIDINEQFCQISGYTREELLGQDHRMLNGGVHPHEFWKEAWQTIRSGKAWRGEVCNRAKDGSLYWVDSIIAPFINANGDVEKYVSIRNDITSRKASELELQNVSERLALATNVAGVGIWEYDLVEETLRWDEQMFALYGVGSDSFSGAYEVWVNGVHPDDRERSDSELQAAIRGEKAFDTEFRVVWPDGSVRYIQAIATVQRNADGQATRMVGTNWDITEQHHSVEQIQAASVALEEAQTVGRMGNWTYDLTTGEVTWSRQLFTLYGRNEEDGPPDFEGVLSDYAPESAAELSEAVQRAATDGTPYSLVMRTSDQVDGARYIRGEGRARRGTDGKVVALFGTAMDVTTEIETAESLQRAQAEAEASNIAKSAFLANMSHEIRTPLTAILGFADLLREEKIDQERRNQAIHTINSAGNHLLTIINDILDLSKIEADKMTVENIDTPLVTILREVESLMRPRAVGKGVQFDAVLKGPVPDRVMSDPTRLRQILMNLAGNAIKFTEIGQVKIEARAEERKGSQRLVLDIKDTGIGLTPDQAGRLFQAFGQANDSVTRKHGGTGLGLTICRRLAELMGGKVKLAHSKPGEGSCFEIDLPLDPAPGATWVDRLDVIDSPGSEQPAAPAKVASLSGRILLAEDGPDNQRLISFHLRKAGATVEIADNGRIALEMIDKSEEAGEPYDLLLTDMQMPEMDGYTLARTLRGRGSKLPVVALTAHAMAEDRAKCEAAGCDDYASKPIDRALLIQTCASWMGQQGGDSRIAKSA